MTQVYVSGLGLWTPRASNIDEWIRGGRQDELERPNCEVLPSRLRRATSLVIRMGVEVIDQALDHAALDVSMAKIVFGSAYGEFQTAIEQMEMMAGEDGRLSPARFKNSVHNTVTGLLSIALKNRGFGTAIAAGSSTFAMSFLEGLTLLDKEGGIVIVSVADDMPSSDFLKKYKYFSPLGVALCLTSEPQENSMGRLSDFKRAESSDSWLESVPELLRANPAAAALPLIHALVHGDGGTIPLELDRESPYCVGLRPWVVKSS